jgi:prepilin signal peptidase PulO-like enzyme (type II secretory pathway)
MPVIIILSILGLCVGSLVNALVWRLHEQSWLKHHGSAPNKELSIVTGRSMCTHCKHLLAPKDLIPVLSWVSLGGRCRYCHHRIEDTPVAELALPLLFVFSYLEWPLSFTGNGLWDFILWLVFLSGFLALAMYDLRWMLLPNKLVIPLMALAIIETIGSVFLSTPSNRGAVILSAIVGAAMLGGTFYILFQLSNGAWIGGGDVKLGVVLGLISGGWFGSLLLLFIASLSGSLVSLPILIRRKQSPKFRVPFGPFLILGLIVVKLYGTDIISWYSTLIYT